MSGHPASGLARFASDADRKALREGAHRAVDLDATLARARKVAREIGVTRIGMLTGLDRIGVPVAMAVRPDALSAAISLGKGVSVDHAMASGLMESIECWHAERIVAPTPFSSAPPGRAVDISRLPPLTDSAWTPATALHWIEGVDLYTGEPLWTPLETAHAAYTFPPPPGSGCFSASTNGLASGNTPTEALVHAMTEVIERDATTLWHFADDARREACRVDLSTIGDPNCRALIQAFDRAGLVVGVWETTSDIGVPAYFAWIMERESGFGGAARSAIGQGCHLCPEIALSRALTEAAQARLTVISGARDDLGDGDYEGDDDEMQTLRRAFLLDGASPRSFDAAPRFESDDLREDARHILARLASVGVHEICAVDLSRAEYGVAVMRVVIPGLEGPHDHDRYAAGARAMAVYAAANGAAA